MKTNAYVNIRITQSSSHN